MYRKAMVLIAILALLLVFSCSKKENPFEPNRDGYNDAEQRDLSFVDETALNPGPGGTINDQDPGTSGIQGELEIYFFDFMNAATVTTSNIVVSNLTSGGSVGGTVTYYAELKKAVYRGTFSDDACFGITLTSGLQNQAGVQFDGNDNGWADGSPYDDFIYTLLTGAGVDTFDFDHPEISSFSPGVSNNVPVGTTITVNFTDGDIDTNTLTTTNVSLAYSSGTAVTCTLVSRSPSQIIIQPSAELDTAAQYTVTVRCASITDEDGNECLGLAGDNMGYIANIPDFTWDFVTDDYGVSGFDGEPPDTASVSVSGEELIVSFDDYMVTSTFNVNNIRVYNDNTGQNLVGSIIPDLDERGFHYTLENAISGAHYTLWISPMVQEQAPGNWYFDGNGNGVGGEWDDCCERPFTY
jgi:hypothetical protein